MLLAGCNPDQPKPPNTPPAPVAQPDPPQHTLAAPPQPKDPVLATLNGQEITRGQLEAPLIEGYGLNVLLNISQLELAKREAARVGVTVSPADLQAEMDLTMKKMFREAKPDEYPQLLQQVLQNQRITRPEFDLVMQTNAYLRKLAEPKVTAQIGDKELQEAFNALYGEKVQIRHIECSNLQEIAEAKRRLATGEKFEDVARALSRNARTAGLGGELPPFSRAAAGYPANFKEAAFGLKEGEVSDAVAVGPAYHVIKLDKRIAPTAIKYQDVKESVREEVTDRLMQATIAAMRNAIAAQMQTELNVVDPVLAKQYQQRLN